MGLKPVTKAAEQEDLESKGFARLALRKLVVFRLGSGMNNDRTISAPAKNDGLSGRSHISDILRCDSRYDLLIDDVIDTRLD